MFCKMQLKLNIFETILKVHPTKRENSSENLKHISLVTWAVTKNQKLLGFVESLEREKIDQLDFFSQKFG